MEGWLSAQFLLWPLWALLLVSAVCLLTIGKGADLLVDEAVSLSAKWGVPPTVIGATIVSLGTTLPEAAVSVAAAIGGNPKIALGNAVGSIIADSGLILGLACMLSPLPLNRAVVNRQGWLQVAAGVLLVLACIPWSSPTVALTEGGNLSQFMGWVFVVLLGGYLYVSFKWSKGAVGTGDESLQIDQGPLPKVLGKLVLGIVLVLVSAQVLIPSIEEVAARLGVPQVILAATLVALGTSLPELVTALTAVRKGHGEIAVGNVIGADILNVLFVAGVAASVTPGGLTAAPQFFTILFPGMLLLLILFRVGIAVNRTHLSRSFGVLLLVVYLIVTASGYVFGDGSPKG